MRIYNNSKYQLDNSAKIDFTDISSYDLNLENVDIKHISGEYLNGFHLKPQQKNIEA